MNNIYLLVTIFHQPKNGFRTEKSTIYDEPQRGRRTKDTSWTRNPHVWNSVEVPEVTTRISAKKLCTASVIIDVKNDKIVKNRFEKTPDDEILAHFKKKYLSEYLNAIASKAEEIGETSV